MNKTESDSMELLKSAVCPYLLYGIILISFLKPYFRSKNSE